MKEFIAENGGFLAVVSMVALAINLLLSGLSKALEVVKDKTKTDTDNKVYDFLAKIMSVLQKVVDWSSGNREHK